MQAVILAAGRGSRLGAKADGLPKCLLQVGGRPLLEHQLRALADIGAGPVLVVLGFAADLVKDVLGDRAETVFNARYDRTNSLYSLWLAREWIREPVLIMNSDVLCDREVYEALARAGPDHLAYDSSSGKAAEHMKVRLDGGTVRDLSKTMPGEESNGENLGVIYLGERAVRRVLDKAGEFIAARRENAFWAEALRAAAAEVPIRGLDMAGIPWVEIDTPYDLDRARRQVWPQIMDRTATVLARRRRRSRVKVSIAALAVLAMLVGVWMIAAAYAVRSWEPVPAQSGRRITLTVGNIPQEWHAGESISTRVTGPRTLRIDTRCLLVPGAVERVPYVVEVTMDGRRVDWHKFGATPDRTIAFEGATVCDRDRIELAVPAGEHAVSLRLVAGDAAGLLARFRILEAQE